MRFSELVKTSGKPEVVALWTDPKNDPRFLQAVKQNRVLTVIQEPRSKKADFAEIGFHRLPHASYFVFPKPLPANQTGRVIGIKYDLVEQPAPKDPIASNELKAAQRKSVRVPKPELKKFDIVLRKIAVAETCISVAATNKDLAKKRAVECFRREPFDPAKAVMRIEVRSVE